jgi:hypothetical protein
MVESAGMVKDEELDGTDHDENTRQISDNGLARDAIITP